MLARSNAIAHYTVKEQYSIYRNGEGEPSAQEIVLASYTVAGGKEYTPLSQSGSSMLRSAVIDKVLAGEKEMAQVANRQGVWVTSANYEMHPEAATVTDPVQLNGHACLIIDLTPKRRSQHLFVGKAWVDAADFTVVRLAGAPSESPSFFAGNTTVIRDYEKVDGFSMAAHAQAHSYNFLLGDTTLKIEYTEYKIERTNTAPGSANDSPAIPPGN